MKPGTVSLEKCTNRRAPPAIAASSRLNVLIMLFSKTTCGALWIGCGIAAVWTTTSMPAASAYAAPASVRSDLPVVLRLARVDPIPDRARQIACPHLVARLGEPRHERAADLAVGAGDEDLHRSTDRGFGRHWSTTAPYDVPLTRCSACRRSLRFRERFACDLHSSEPIRRRII